MIKLTMSPYFRIIVSFVIAFNCFFIKPSYAQVNNQISTDSLPKDTKGSAAEFNYQVTNGPYGQVLTDAPNQNKPIKSNTVELKYQVTDGKYGKVLTEIPIDIPDRISSKDSLKNAFSTFTDSINGVTQKTKNGISLVKPISALNQTIRQFPLEFIGFQAGIGFLMLMDMSVRYHNNPMAFQQTLETLLLTNGIGAFSFFAFMYASRLSGPILQKLIFNPRFFAYFPMFMGMVASNFSHFFLEPLVPCARSLTLKYEVSKRMVVDKRWPDACRKAYDDFVIKDSFIQMAPTIISGLLSFAVVLAFTDAVQNVKNLSKAEATNNGASKVESSKASTAKFAAKAEEVFLKGFKNKWSLLLLTIPGLNKVSIITNSLNKIYHVAKGAVIFVGIDMFLIHPIVNYAWKNLVTGPNLTELAQDITLDLFELKMAHWKDEIVTKSQSDSSVCKGKQSLDCLLGFPAKLYTFHNKMAEWRQKNMEEAQMSHMAWSTKFSKLTMMYEAAYQTYSKLISDIRLSHITGYSAIDRDDPFYGIKPVASTEIQRDLLLNDNFLNQLETKERYHHYKMWNNASGVIQNYLSTLQNEANNQNLNKTQRKLAEKLLKSKEYAILSDIAHKWNPQKEFYEIRIIQNILVTDKISPTLRKEIRQIANTTCKNTIPSNNGFLTKLLKKKLENRSSTELQKIRNCISFIEKDMATSMLAGARLFSSISSRDRGDLSEISPQLKIAIKEFNDTLGENTAKLSYLRSPDVDKDTFLNDPSQIEYLQYNKLRQASIFIDEELTKLRENKREKMTTELTNLEKIGNLWNDTEDREKINKLKNYDAVITSYLNGEKLNFSDKKLLSAALNSLENNLTPSDVNEILAQQEDSKSFEKYRELLSNLRSKSKKEVRHLTDKIDARFDKGVELYSKLIKSQTQASRHPITQKLIIKVGASNPHHEVGRAYLKNFAIHSDYVKYYEELSFPSVKGAYPIKTPAEYFVYQMICGPDAELGHSLVEKSYFSYDTFTPPRIRSNNHYMTQFCDPHFIAKRTEHRNKKMYTDTFTINFDLSKNGDYSKTEKKEYHGILAYLKDNIRTSVLDLKQAELNPDDDYSGNYFTQWWDKNVASNLNNLLDSYADDYTKVIQVLHESFKSKGTLRAKNPISASPIESILQESRFYLTIINEITKDLGNSKLGLDKMSSPDLASQFKAMFNPSLVEENDKTMVYDLANSGITSVENEISDINDLDPKITLNYPPLEADITNFKPFYDGYNNALLEILPNGPLDLFKALKTERIFSIDSIIRKSDHKKTKKSYQHIPNIIKSYDDKLIEILNIFNSIEGNIAVENLSETFDTHLEELAKIQKEIFSRIEANLFKTISKNQRDILTQTMESLSNINLELNSYKMLITLLNYKLMNKNGFDESNSN